MNILDKIASETWKLDTTDGRIHVIDETHRAVCRVPAKRELAEQTAGVIAELPELVRDAMRFRDLCRNARIAVQHDDPGTLTSGVILRIDAIFHTPPASPGEAFVLAVDRLHR